MKKIGLSDKQIERIAQYYQGKPLPSKMDNDDLFSHMLDSAKEEVDFFLDSGMSLDEAISSAKSKSSAGQKVWDTIREMYGESE